MSEQDLKDLCASLCQSREIDPQLAKAIITQESHWNYYAIRYEPKYGYPFKPEKYLDSSFDTEMILQKCSFGLCQIMGAVAREQGHLGFLTELLDPAVNILQMCKLLTRLKKISPIQDDMIAMYNGGKGALSRDKFGKYKNQGYVDSVNEILKGV